ncbi:hypothetical protein EYZ11_011735 [Aspergillus tanneri]|uniref:Uncharacterized protein n=1 Tax=Aspergillus tanneri TaxID=1220188 RepID=A0A4S3J471_9EURO|nr:hypothetical protein EYZ11_011735 [Aspergillus tanneri]
MLGKFASLGIWFDSAEGAEYILNNGLLIGQRYFGSVECREIKKKRKHRGADIVQANMSGSDVPRAFCAITQTLPPSRSRQRTLKSFSSLFTFHVLHTPDEASAEPALTAIQNTITAALRDDRRSTSVVLSGDFNRHYPTWGGNHIQLQLVEDANLLIKCHLYHENYASDHRATYSEWNLQTQHERIGTRSARKWFLNAFFPEMNIRQQSANLDTSRTSMATYHQARDSTIAQCRKGFHRAGRG